VVLTVISAIELTDPMDLVNSGLAVNEGTTTTLTSSQLQADIDDPPDTMVYTLGTAPGPWQSAVECVALTSGQTFTQDDIIRAR